MTKLMIILQKNGDLSQKYPKISQNQAGMGEKGRTMPKAVAFLQKTRDLCQNILKPGWNRRAGKNNAKTDDNPSKNWDLSQNIPPKPRSGVKVDPIPVFPVPPAAPCTDSGFLEKNEPDFPPILREYTRQ